MATSTTYNRAFWNVMKGKEENNQNLIRERFLKNVCMLILMLIHQETTIQMDK